MTNLNENALVKYLFLADWKEWNVQLVQKFFWEEETQTIIYIPISMWEALDKLIYGIQTMIPSRLKAPAP